MKSRYSQGLSLIELIVVIGMLLTLIAIASVGLRPIRNSTPIDTAITTFTANLRSQQLKAMTGDVEGGSSNEPYGIYMDGSDYVLFRGESYSASDPTNFESSLGQSLVFSTVNFPSSSVVFENKSGEIVNYDPSNNQIVVQDTITNGQRIITLNALGIVISIE